MPFSELENQVVEILKNNTQTTNYKLTAICRLLQKRIPHYDWVGFYFADDEKPELHLRAFAGEPTEHTVIPFGKGICGQVAVSNQNFVVPDVASQDNYIACSIYVKSEIVIPLFKNGKNIGQIDIDSHTKNAFSEKDEHFLEWVNEQTAEILNEFNNNWSDF